MIRILFASLCCFGVMAQAVFINEFHYDNTGTDTGEFVEIAGPAGTNLSGWSIVLYNGANGQSYDTIALTGLLPDQSMGGGTLSFLTPGIQNGSPDGIVLYDGVSVVQFLSYEGSFTATNGVASGMTSTDVGVVESSSTPIGQSLQLIDIVDGAKVYTDFQWTGPVTESPGAVNTNQTLPVELQTFSVE
ncbi:MAG: hypothetical protein KDC35_19845 [Acidobacteria bacterium]|nr:hypothetical protein [Acidobacteriota bacterium]